MLYHQVMNLPMGAIQNDWQQGLYIVHAYKHILSFTKEIIKLYSFAILRNIRKLKEKFLYP